MVTADRARELLSLHGKTQPQLPADWTGTFPLPASVERYYQQVGPADVIIESYGNPFFLPRLSDLWKLQAGYRWDGCTGEQVEDWKEEWLVVGHDGGGAFIFSCASGVVLYDVHGKGFWEPGELFPDLNAMAACLAQLGALVRSAGEAFTDEDFVIRPDQRDRAVAGLRELLGSTSDAEFVVATLGWC